MTSEPPHSADTLPAEIAHLVRREPNPVLIRLAVELSSDFHDDRLVFADSAPASATPAPPVTRDRTVVRELERRGGGLLERLAVHDAAVAIIAASERHDAQFGEALRRYPAYVLDPRLGHLIRVPGGNEQLTRDLLDSAWLDCRHLALAMCRSATERHQW